MRVGLGTQLGLTALVIGGLLLLGLAAGAQHLGDRPPVTFGAGTTETDWGVAMAFVFLAYGAIVGLGVLAVGVLLWWRGA